MKPNKMNLGNIQGKLSRNEMKNIMAGDAPVTNGCYRCCITGTTNCSACSWSSSGSHCVEGATLTKEGCPASC